MQQVLLGIDVGTASSKGVLATADGRVLRTAARPHELLLPRPGWAEADAESTWWGDIVALCRELLGSLDPAQVAGVCVSGLGPCLLACDQNLRPLRPAILYGIDTRASAEIVELTEKYGAEALFKHCGKSLSSQAVGPKMLWLQRNEPEVWARTAAWFSSHSYAVGKLTGEYVLDHHTASQCDPLYDITKNTWSAQWTAELSAGVPLPRLVWPAEVVGEVHAAAAAETGIPAGTPVCAGTIDAWAEAFSAGVRDPGDLMVMYGSTMFLIQVLPEFASHPTLWTTAGLSQGQYTLAAGMATSGSLTGWLRDLSNDVTYEELVAEATAVPAGSDGLLMLPYFAGERTPHFDPHARGVLAGLTLRHTRGHLFRAAYEGIAFGLRQILELTGTAAGPAARVVAVGGGTQGGLWTQIVSDVIGREQVIPRQTIGASYGDTLLAAIGSGLVPADTDWATADHLVLPNPQNKAVYDDLYNGFRELYPATRDVVHRLAAHQESAQAASTVPPVKFVR